MKRKSLAILLMLSCVGLGRGDIIKLRSGQTIEGQLLKVTPEFIIVEVLSSNAQGIKNISIKRELVENVIDENGRTLFEKNRIRATISSYYESQFNASFESSDPSNARFKNLPDTVYLKDGKKGIVHVISIDNGRLLFRAVDNSRETGSHELYLPLNVVDRINARKIDYFIEKKNVIKRIAHYPHLVFELGGTGVLTQLHNVQKLFQDYYDYSQLPLIADQVKGVYVGAKLSLLLKITRKIMFGFTGYSNLQKDRNVRISQIEGRYLFPRGNLRPYIGVGYAWQSVSIIDRQDYHISSDAVLRSVKYERRANGIAVNFGLDIGRETGAGIFVNAHYFLLSKKIPAIEGTPSGQSVPASLNRAIDHSSFSVSLGYRFNY